MAGGRLTSVSQRADAALSEFTAENFRCIEHAQIALDSRINVFTGGNGAGKTSLLEAIYVLGRGRSFRTADNRVLIQAGHTASQITGQVLHSSGPTHLGLRISLGGLDIHVGGRPGASAVDLATALPVQAIHSDIGGLVQGGPEARRRLLDWGVFHVKQSFLSDWRYFRRALAQRNAALREGAADEILSAWELELAAAAQRVHEQREAFVGEITRGIVRLGELLTGVGVEVRYLQGWPPGESLEKVLHDNRESDRMVGYTRLGPHRADLQVEAETMSSRWRASTGQQKLLGSALVLAQCEVVAEVLGRPVALLVDEPAADLDRERLTQFLTAILAMPAQVFLAAISLDGLPLPGAGTVFHVEHGKAKALL